MVALSGVKCLVSRRFSEECCIASSEVGYTVKAMTETIFSAEPHDIPKSTTAVMHAISNHMDLKTAVQTMGEGKLLDHALSSVQKVGWSGESGFAVGFYEKSLARGRRALKSLIK